MGKPVELADIVEAIDFQLDDSSAYVNTETGEVVSFREEEFRLAEEEDGPERALWWQREMVEDAQDVLESDHYLRLPDKFEVHEYAIMERFCLSLENERVRERLLEAIRGSGAFRRFKDGIRRWGVEQQWYAYRAEALREIAIEWCKGHGVEYVE